jgi:hypothetical protein
MIDVVVQQNNKGPRIFGESANTNKKEDTTVNKPADPKYSMPDGAHRDLHDRKSENYSASEQRRIRKRRRKIIQ